MLQIRRQHLDHFLRLLLVHRAQPVVFLEVREHEVRMLLLELVAHDDAVEHQRAGRGEVARLEQDLAVVGDEVAEDRMPDVRARRCPCAAMSPGSNRA